MDFAVVNLSVRRFCPQHNRVFHDRPVWRISVWLSDRSEVTHHKINFVINCHRRVWTHNLLIIILLLCQLSQAGICWRFLKWAFFCLMHHFTCWTLFISRINRAWLYKGLNDSHLQPNSDLAQLAEHETDDLEFKIERNFKWTHWIRQITDAWVVNLRSSLLPVSLWCWGRVLVSYTRDRTAILFWE